MDDGEIELSDTAFLPFTASSPNNPRGSTAVDSTIDELLKHTRTCTHTHTCNPAGPDATHIHTCYHTHTQVFSSGDDTKTHSETSSLKRRRPLGNREAVRKYREKKKAHTAYLEEEVKKLRLDNQQLARKLQGQAALEAELLRLRTLLVELRVKIDCELGSFPFFKHCSSDTSGGAEAISLQCGTQLPCFGSIGNQSMSIVNGEGDDKGVFSWEGNCQSNIIDCHVNESGVVAGSEYQLDGVETMISNTTQGQ